MCVCVCVRVNIVSSYVSIQSDFLTILNSFLPVKMLKFIFFYLCSCYHKTYDFYNFFFYQFKGVL